MVPACYKSKHRKIIAGRKRKEQKLRKLEEKMVFFFFASFLSSFPLCTFVAYFVILFDFLVLLFCVWPGLFAILVPLTQWIVGPVRKHQPLCVNAVLF